MEAGDATSPALESRGRPGRPAAAAGLPMATSAGRWLGRHSGPSGAARRRRARGRRGRGVAPYFVRTPPPRGSTPRARLRLRDAAVAAVVPDCRVGRGGGRRGRTRRGETDARQVTFEGLPLSSPWPAMVRERWPGLLRPTAFRPWIRAHRRSRWAGLFAAGSRAGAPLPQPDAARDPRPGARRRTGAHEPPASLSDDLEAMLRLHAALGGARAVGAGAGRRRADRAVHRPRARAGRERPPAAPGRRGRGRADLGSAVRQRRRRDRLLERRVGRAVREAAAGGRVLARSRPGSPDAARVLSLGGGARATSCASPRQRAARVGPLLVPRPRAAATGAAASRELLMVARRLAQAGSPTPARAVARCAVGCADRGHEDARPAPKRRSPAGRGLVGADTRTRTGDPSYE